MRGGDFDAHHSHIQKPYNTPPLKTITDTAGRRCRWRKDPRQELFQKFKICNTHLWKRVECRCCFVPIASSFGITPTQRRWPCFFYSTLSFCTQIWHFFHSFVYWFFKSFSFISILRSSSACCRGIDVMPAFFVWSRAFVAITFHFNYNSLFWSRHLFFLDLKSNTNISGEPFNARPSLNSFKNIQLGPHGYRLAVIPQVASDTPKNLSTQFVLELLKIKALDFVVFFERKKKGLEIDSKKKYTEK